MDSFNNSKYNPVIFTLLGIPGLEDLHVWISILYCAVYIIAFLGNATILFIIKRERSLHEPMYFFLSMLAINDIGLALTTFPTMLSTLWFEHKEITFDTCLIQMFFLQTFTLMESSVLLAMAFDRFIAICNPLRYASILTNAVITKIGVAIIVRATALEIPLISLLKRLSFCKTNLLSHSFCFHADFMKLACTDTRINSIYGLFVVLSTSGIDSLFIFISYIMIIKTVLSITSKEGCFNAFNTCLSHICAVLTFYILIVGLSVVHRLGKNVPPLIYSVMGDLCFLLPPLLNPIIYSIKTKQIRREVLKMLRTWQDQI